MDTYCKVGTIPEPSESGAGEIGVMGPPGVDGCILMLDGGMTGVGPNPKWCKVPGDTTGLCKREKTCWPYHHNQTILAVVVTVEAWAQGRFKPIV